MIKYIVVILMAFISTQTFAIKKPSNGLIDPRIKLITYNERDVINITTHYGFSTMIELGKDETIETISLGDSLAWNFLDVKNRIFIKPVEDNADTNMQVITDKHVYNFSLNAKKSVSHNSKELTFTVKFRYPQDELKIALNKRKLYESSKAPKPHEIMQNHIFKANDINMEYTFSGDKDIAPRRVFDDGVFTYFYFNKLTENPAIFVSDVNGDKESLVNFHVKGKYIVVQRLARKYTLRHGGFVTCVFNEHFKPDFEQKTWLSKQGTKEQDQRLIERN